MSDGSGLWRALKKSASSWKKRSNSRTSGGIYVSLFQRLGSAAPRKESSIYFHNRNKGTPVLYQALYSVPANLQTRRQAHLTTTLES